MMKRCDAGVRPVQEQQRAGDRLQRRRPQYFWLLTLLFVLAPLSARAAPQTLFDQVQAALQSRNPDAYLALLTSDPDLQTREKQFLADFLDFKYTRCVFQLMEEKDGRLLVHVFAESPQEARFESWNIRTVTNGDQTKIADRDVISQVSGLYRLRLSDRSFPVRDFQFTHLHTVFQLKQGRVFPILAGPNLTGIFFIGKGNFEFNPVDAIERQQVKLFNKREELKTSINHFYLRTSSDHLRKLFGPVIKASGEPAPADFERASGLLREYDQTPFSVKIPFTEELWYPALQDQSLYCELHTKAGTLIYQHAPGEPDDVLLAERDRRRVISLYNSSGVRLALEKEPCEMHSYRMRASFDPRNTYLSAVSSTRLRCKEQTALVVFKLSSELGVTHVKSSQGSLIYFQEEKTSNLNIVLNEHLEPDEELQLEIAYSGVVTPEVHRTEAAPADEAGKGDFYLPPTYLYSNRSLWYPQFTSNPYLQAEISVTVPDGYVAVANGKLVQTETDEKNKRFTYALAKPAKYLSLFVGQLDHVSTFESIVPIRVYHMSYDNTEAKKFAQTADRILRFYSNYFGSYPYENLNIILRPLQTPGGHSPAAMVIINRVYSFLGARFKKDPLNHPDYPNLLVAHEIAHQWWGQAVGWRTYRDQWISEGFAQFAAWEFIRQDQGEEAGSKLGRVFYDWIKEKSYAGPIVLGARLGHLTNDPQAFTALLYNKSAYVLAMLKNWIGAEKFQACLSEFYSDNSFQLAGFREFATAAENQAGPEINKFLEPWLKGWNIPTVRWSQLVAQEKDRVLRIRFAQPEDSFYRMAIPVQATGPNGKTFIAFATLDQPQTDVEIQLPFHASRIEIDPYGQTLMKAVQR